MTKYNKDPNIKFNDIVRLKSFKKLQDLGWYEISTPTQKIRKRIVLRNRASEDSHKIISILYPEAGVGEIRTVTNKAKDVYEIGARTKPPSFGQYTRDIHNIESYSFYNKVFTHILDNYIHDSVDVIDKKRYDKHLRFKFTNKKIYTPVDIWGSMPPYKLQFTKCLNENSYEILPKIKDINICYEGAFVEQDNANILVLHVALNQLAQYHKHIISMLSKTKFVINKPDNLFYDYNTMEYKEHTYSGYYDLDEESLPRVINRTCGLFDEFVLYCNKRIENAKTSTILYHGIPDIHSMTDLENYVSNCKKEYTTYIQDHTNADISNFKYFLPIIKALRLKLDNSFPFKALLRADTYNMFK